MELGGRTVLLCDCGGSLPLDGAALARACGITDTTSVARELCRADAGRLTAALAAGTPLLIACTQETPLFEELRAEYAPNGSVRYANIRERAGWSDEGAAALPKMAALLTEALEPSPEALGLALSSGGSLVVLARDSDAIAIARQVADRMDVTVLLWPADTITLPALDDIPVFRGRVTAARGHLGAFELVVDDHATVVPSGRGAARFGAPRSGVSVKADLILDLTGKTPLFPAHGRRDGYRRADPDRAAEIHKALLDLSGLVGEFEKPRYVDFNAGLCAHARNLIRGCSRCVDLCPTGAITPNNGNAVALDPHVCGGCGSCAAVCPTGATSYTLPPDTVLLRRLHRLLTTYRQAGGHDPVVLFHDDHHGSELIAAMARHGRGLPARVMPVSLNEVARLGLDALAAPLAWGAAQVRILPPAGNAPELEAIAGQVDLMAALLDGLGLERDRVALLHGDDPDVIADVLYALPRPTEPVEASGFLPMGNRRTILAMALEHLHARSPGKPDVVALPDGAPFGTVAILTDRCTLCLACTGACPTHALRDHPEKPGLRFVEELCIQCGLCTRTCPEKVVTLAPRYAFSATAGEAVVLKEEEPFACIRCGKPFGVRSTIEHIIACLAGKHSMFTNPAVVNRMRMCGDCRVVDEIGQGDNPFAQQGRPRPRTTDDYR